MRWITPTVARREEKCDKENHRNQFNRKISENDMLQSYSLMDMWTLTSISINRLCASSTSCPWRSYKPLFIKCLMNDRRLFCRNNDKVFLHMTLLCSDNVLFSIPLLHPLFPIFPFKAGPLLERPPVHHMLLKSDFMRFLSPPLTCEVVWPLIASFSSSNSH